jgi:hypothetical protein
MNCNTYKSVALLQKLTTQLLMVACIAASGSVMAGAREQAKRIHDRLTGVSPTNAVLQSMEDEITNNSDPVAAARIAMQNSSFYNVTLKNFAAPWTNEDQTMFVPLNDYTATVVGMIRDNKDFHEVLYGDILYVNASQAYSNTSNASYEALEQSGADLSDSAVLVERTQSSVTQLPADATAGVVTSRASSASFFVAGTNRSMFRFTYMNHLCTDIDPLKDVSRVPDRVRRDASRSPGGDSRIYMNSCIGCHAGMDAMLGAYAYYDFNADTGQLDYQTNNEDIPNPLGDPIPNPNRVVKKFNHNETTFKYGYVQTDDSWLNYWRNGQNSLLGWYNDVPLDENGHSTGSGAKELGIEMARSDAFDSCQVKKVFKTVCLRDSNAFQVDRNEVQRIASIFKADGNMQNVFAEVAGYCKGQ